METKQISIEQFFEVDLRVAKIVSAEKIENADKLLKLMVDVGEERRQLVAGIAQDYETDSLVGKLIIVVTNLEPARIRGVESQGMLLAATDGNDVILLTTDKKANSGAPIK